jgi:hypothetical protein
MPRRRPALLAPLLALLLAATLSPAGTLMARTLTARAVPGIVVPGVSTTTGNVEHVGYLPEVGPSVSGRVVEVDGQRRFYVGSVGGLAIYDVDDPAAPQLLGRLPLAGFQNEDIAVAADGSVAVLAYGDINGYTFNYVVDTSDPQRPVLASTTGGGDHTAECVTDDCSVLWGSEGNIYDLTDLSNPVTLPTTWIQHARTQGVNIQGFPHKVVRDSAGYVITDSNPRVVFEITDPFAPQVVGRSAPFRAADNLRYQHNNLRPRAEEFQAREEGDDDPALRPGELLLANGETNLTVDCDGTGGPFFTMDMRDFDSGREFTVLDTFRPLDNGTYVDGDPAVNVLGCSGHWFDWTADGDDYVVAAAWFEHGVRFLEVDAATGAIGEVGFFQPYNGSAAAAYWIDDEYVYVTDYVRGVDILRFDRDPDLRPDQAELDANWIAGLSLPRLPATAAEQLVCRLAVSPR